MDNNYIACNNDNCRGKNKCLRFKLFLDRKKYKDLTIMTFFASDCNYYKRLEVNNEKNKK